MNAFIHHLLEAGTVIADGAWGTELQARGLQPGELPDAWNLEHPERVTEVARSYVAAGSRVILTNTFGANRFRMAGHALAHRVVEINRKGVLLSRQAAEGRACVFASLGPSGKLLLSGDATEEELRAAFDEQAEALADGGADAIVVETITDLAEARIAVAAARATGLPVVACMVFDSGKQNDRTMMGATPEQTAAALTEAGADVVGANCGVGIAQAVPVCRRMRTASNRPIWIKPNAGLPTMEGDRAVYRTTPDEFASFVPALHEAGASIIGGCCGTTPDFVRALRAKLGQTGAAGRTGRLH